MKADDFSSQEHRHYGKRRRSSRTRLILILGLSLAFETSLLIMAFVRMGVAEQEATELAIVERKQTAELESLRPQVEKLHQDLDNMVHSRLPGLHRLEFDHVITLEDNYVKNIVFTVAGKGQEKQYEYKLVTHNGTLSLIHPRVDILIFDRAGIQIGLARIGVQKDGTPTLDMLDRGEIRSFSSKIELTDNAQPEYFRLRVYP
jgi:cell division protein FtsB